MRPSTFVPRFASDLDLPKRVRRQALKLAEAGEEAGIATRVQPSGFAAACIYQAGQEGRFRLHKPQFPTSPGRKRRPSGPIGMLSVTSTRSGSGPMQIGELFIDTW